MDSDLILEPINTGVKCPLCGKDDCRKYDTDHGCIIFVCPDCSRKHHKNMEDDYGKRIDSDTGDRGDAVDGERGTIS